MGWAPAEADPSSPVRHEPKPPRPKGAAASLFTDRQFDFGSFRPNRSSGAAGTRIQGRFKACGFRMRARRKPGSLQGGGQASARTIPRGRARAGVQPPSGTVPMPGIQGNVGLGPVACAIEKASARRLASSKPSGMSRNRRNSRSGLSLRVAWPLSFGERRAAAAERPPGHPRLLPPCGPACPSLHAAQPGYLVGLPPSPASGLHRGRRGPKRLSRTAPSTGILPLQVSKLFCAARGCAGNAAIAMTEEES